MRIGFSHFVSKTVNQTIHTKTLHFGIFQNLINFNQRRIISLFGIADDDYIATDLAVVVIAGAADTIYLYLMQIVQFTMSLFRRREINAALFDCPRQPPTSSHRWCRRRRAAAVVSIAY